MPSRDDESTPNRPTDQQHEAPRGVGFGVTAIFLLVILAVVVGVVVLG